MILILVKVYMYRSLDKCNILPDTLDGCWYMFPPNYGSIAGISYLDPLTVNEYRFTCQGSGNKVSNAHFRGLAAFEVRLLQLFNDNENIQNTVLTYWRLVVTAAKFTFRISIRALIFY